MAGGARTREKGLAMIGADSETEFDRTITIGGLPNDG
jgi:hypothetical protein